MVTTTERPKIQTSLMHKGRVTIWHLQQKKDNGEKIVQISPGAMDPMFSLWAELAGIDIIRYASPGEFWGDRGDNLLSHTRQIRSLAKNIHLNAFIPNHLVSTNDKAFEYCSVLLADGADSCLIMDIKNEMVEYLSDRNVSLFGHVGALSGWQTAIYGGYKRLGKTAEEAFSYFRTAYEYQEAGMKALTVELIPEEVAQKIADKLTIPVIGIAAGAPCDGSELVIYDMLGMMPNPGVHAKVYGDLPGFVAGAFAEYANDVRTGAYPQPENGFLMDEVEYEKFSDMVDRTFH